MTLENPRRMRDERYVREQYASETGLAARASIYERTTGPSRADAAFAATVEAKPRRLLDVGCGTGWFGARVEQKLGIVVAIDQSERTVELARAAGVDARVADVQDLPFRDAEFDTVSAHWMLYYVVDRIPEHVRPFVARRSSVVFVATK